MFLKNYLIVNIQCQQLVTFFYKIIQICKIFAFSELLAFKRTYVLFYTSNFVNCVSYKEFM